MKYSAALVALGIVALAGCDGDPVGLEDGDRVELGELGFYEITILRTLPEGAEAAFGDLNENGQAVWHEGEQAFLWDDGSVLEIPVGEFLGSSGEVLGDSSLWRGGEITGLPGHTRGIHEDGTVYLSRNDTLFTWRDGTLAATDTSVGLVGPEGRIWQDRANPNEHPDVRYDEEICGFYQDGAWHGIVIAAFCKTRLVEEGGWAIIRQSGGTNPGEYVFNPDGTVVWIRDDGGFNPRGLAHVNAHGATISSDGFLEHPGGDGFGTDLRDHFEDPLTLGAINDDGAILAQLGNQVVLLTPIP